MQKKCSKNEYIKDCILKGNIFHKLCIERCKRITFSIRLYDRRRIWKLGKREDRGKNLEERGSEERETKVINENVENTK